MANDHYISRFLTKDWEETPGKLRYFDFKDQKFDLEDSKKLFAAEGLNSPELEEFFRKNIENIVAQERRVLLSEEAAVLSSWRKFRAFYLLFILQSGRTLEATHRDGRLEKILELSQSDLDQLVYSFAQEFRLVRIAIPHGHRLCFPSTGLFPYWVTRPQEGTPNPEFITCHGLPIHPRVLITLVPHTVSDSELSQVISDASMMNRSLGVGPYCTRAVVHPEIFRLNDPEILATRMIEFRRLGNQTVSAMNYANEIKRRYPWVR